MTARFNQFEFIRVIAATLALFLLTKYSYAEDEHWVQRINMSGVLETNFSSGESYSGDKSSDITAAKLEVYLNAKVNEKITAYTVFKYEEDNTPLLVDAAYIDANLGVVSVQVGSKGAPFGSFAKLVLSDPLTKALGETAESVLQVSAEFGQFKAAAYIFNGSTQEAGGDDVADQNGISLAYVSENKGSSMDLGVDYINNIADSNTIGNYLENDTSGPQSNKIKAYVPASIFHANLSFGGFHFIAEHLVTDQFDAAEIAFNSKGAEITATNIEIGYDLVISGMESTLAVASQSTEEAVALGMPKTKTLAAISLGIAKYTALSFEYANSTDYDVADSGTGKSATSYTVQIAVGF